MIVSKHIDRIVAGIMAAAILLCLCAMLFSDQLLAAEGSSKVTMEYETKLFDTQQVLEVNILIPDADWQTMLDNALQEEYVACDVEIGGTTIYNVGIRPKGNTSLTSIASDPTTDRYSFKLEFDHYVEGQTCFGLDKLVLNNNYADATNMKEALIYDMYQFLGADASLYNYAKLSVNGEYWGVYLALEAVEESFLLRNYGVKNGNLYKPESSEMGGGQMPGGNRDDSMQPQLPNGMENFDFSQFSDNLPEDFDVSQLPGNLPNGFNPFSGSDASGENTDAPTPPDNLPDAQMPSTSENTMPDDFDPSQQPGEGMNAPSMPQNNEQAAPPDGNMPEDGGKEDSFTPSMPDASFENNESTMPDKSDLPEMPGNGKEGRGGFEAMGGFGGFSFGSSGADLNYTDDSLDSYSAIWDSEVTSSGKSDHKRVIAALKAASEGNDLEEYLNTDNLLRYLAVHIFSVNEDSLSGMMAHNYYLYEYDGQVNLIPWDYNLAFGGMSGGDASKVVNSPIDDAFSITTFFDALLEDEDYHAQYYAYLQQLIEEYVSGGGLDAFYSRVRSQIDSLVESDPTAFYTYEEYADAAEMLYQTVQRRGMSIAGQLSGDIPSTESAQRSSNALIDASDLDISSMGTMNMGGGRQSFDRNNEDESSFRNNGNAQMQPMEALSAPSQPDSMKNAAPNDVFGDFSPQGVGSVKSTVLLYCGCILLFVLALLLAALYRRKT